MDKPLRKQVRPYEETFSAADAVKEKFLPSEPWQETGQRCGWTDTGVCQARIAKACQWPACSREGRV